MDYTVFFDTRKVVFTKKFADHLNDHYGLFIKYQNPAEFAKLLEFFNSMPSAKNLFFFGSSPKDMFEIFSHQFNLVEAAGGLVRNGDGAYLMIKRNGVWDLPKGKTEKNESIEHSAIREVSEECGISNPTIEGLICTTYHTYSRDGSSILKRTHWYSMVYNGTQEPMPQKDEGITEVKWVPANQVNELLKGAYGSIQLVFASLGTI
jgi:ADP-ribose pyrophosphatase YjhB (NUDIX family)